MSYFTKEFIDFFKELDRNNNKAWFDKNRKRYEEHVKVPFKDFVDVMILRIKSKEPELNITSKDALFRINRDIRFSKDKRPYNPHVSANISQGGRKSADHPGFYFQLSYDKVMIGGGAYHIEKDSLYWIRQQIAKSPADITKLTKNKKFKDNFGEIQGETIKRIPPEFKDAFEKQPLIANKQFFFMTEVKPAIILKADLPDKLMDYYNSGYKINEYLRSALTSK
jgi:uncharacterized protein (TIGR02453 family)